MKTSLRLLWGVLLIAGGLLALTQAMGYVRQVAAEVWIGVFVVVTLLGLIGYLQSGRKEWGWLFPVGIGSGLAITFAMAISGVNKPFVGTPLFIGLLLPFVVAYLNDRARNWWALIPGGIMLFLALITLLVDSISDTWIGTLALLMIALSFLAVALSNRQHTWAWIVAYVCAVLSLAPLLLTEGEGIGYYSAFLLLAIALPFFVIYLRSAARWWAIIPAGALTTTAIVAALAIAGFIRSQSEGGYVNTIMMGGLAATFAVVGWRHARGWAKIVTIVLAVLALSSLIFVNSEQVIGPVALIVIGGYLLYVALRRKAT